MPNLLTILSFLLCPLMMGGAMWLLMRASKDAPPGVAQQGPLEPAATRPLPAKPSPAGGMFTIAGICLNWRVVAGLALVGGGVWVLAPNLVGAALPLLLVAACPLSMLLMMRGMQQRQPAPPPAPGRLPAGTGQTREEYLAALRAEQEEIAREIARLEAAPLPPVAALESGPRTSSEQVRVQA